METINARVLREGLAFGESPRWHEGRLWYSDFYRRAIYSLDSDGVHERLEVEVPGQPSGLGWLPDGDLLFVSMTDHHLRRRRRTDTTDFADLTPYCGFWTNDMVVGSTGVSYVGNFGFDLDQMVADVAAEGLGAWLPVPTVLVVLGPDGAVRQVVPDLDFPNGTVLLRDERTLVVAETTAFRLSAFDVAEDGTLSRRRVWAQLDGVAPDGICLDVEGQIWVADALTPRCLRVGEGGTVSASVATSQRAFACALGGESGSSLFVMTAPDSSRFTVAERTDGRIEVAPVDVPGVGSP